MPLKDKEYNFYGDYVKEQISKLSTKHLLEDLQANYDKVYKEDLKKRLRTYNLDIKSANVLCLGARIGTEVKAFLEMGHFAVGIDLISNGFNKFVLEGDFHSLQFPAECVDVVFTNSLDHVYDLDIMLHEVQRVLKYNGFFLSENVLGVKEGGEFGPFESLTWDYALELVNEIQKHSIKITNIYDCVCNVATSELQKKKFFIGRKL